MRPQEFPSAHRVDDAALDPGVAEGRALKDRGEDRAPAPGSPAEATLGALADAGGMARAGTPSYYSEETAAELAGIIGNTVTTGTSCTFTLPAAPNPEMGRNDSIDVFVDGLRVPRDVAHLDGWDYADASHTALQFYGPICGGLIAGTVVSTPPLLSEE